jgi:copper chaperone NosL
MMSKGSRILVLVAALALGLVYVLPIWTIDLEAPQYPEGIGMVIRVNTIEGQKPQDLGNINNLNHYIGMKRIVPESIPELKVMPVIVGILMLLGVLAAATGRRVVLHAWVGTFLLVSAVGLADFWKWEYDYGHDLDEENAIIKIPGMTYQPPLIGSKQLLNFRARSWPGAGGWILIASCLVGVGVVVHEHRRARGRDPEGRDVPSPVKRTSRRSISASAAGIATAAAVSSLSGCSEPRPRPVEINVELCEHCLMNVSDAGRAAEILTPTGRVYAFDSIECMVGHLQGDMEGEQVHSAWVTDFAHPPALVRVERAHFLESDALPSSMGMGLTAFARAADRDRTLREVGGRALDWEGVQDLVRESWPDGRPLVAHGGHASALLPFAPGLHR